MSENTAVDLLEKSLNNTDTENDFLNFWLTTKVNWDRKFITRIGKYPEQASRIHTNFLTVFRIYLENIFKAKLMKDRSQMRYTIKFDADDCFFNLMYNILVYCSLTGIDFSNIGNTRLRENQRYSSNGYSRTGTYELSFPGLDRLYVKDCDLLIDTLTTSVNNTLDSKIEEVAWSFFSAPHIRIQLNLPSSSSKGRVTNLSSATASSDPVTRRYLDLGLDVRQTAPQPPALSDQDRIEIEYLNRYDTQFSHMRDQLGLSGYYEFLKGFVYSELNYRIRLSANRFYSNQGLL